MIRKFNIGLAVCALGAMVSANPAFAAGATRSAQALPMLAASVGSVAYSPGVENTWRCVQVSDEALKLKKKHVNVDQAGRVVLSPKGAPYGCKPSPSGYKVSSGGGFPFEIVLGLAGLGGALLALAGSKGSDSPG
ncbi:hypothetical protein [Erythrobacter sp. SG61-1L]|uniref:hypothetical protein n=1 Tax=Erythrobacter sp. SG61-1L TaxID=1603897 RepID=UPI000B2D038A|nr:hypothetical protein [Erythrobacter sp. SG61-1L]